MSVRKREATTQVNGRANGNANGHANGHVKTPKYVADAETDHTRWRMRDIDGAHTWHYLTSDEELKAWPMSAADKWYLGMDTGAPQLKQAQTPMEAAHNGVAFYSRLQLQPGNWGCEYGGPMFLLPGLIITLYVTDMRLTQPEETEIVRYIFKIQNIGVKNGGDGGWGLHIEGDSSVFGTGLNYTTLRLLGVPADDPRMQKARQCLHEMGGAVNGPHWSKFWLSILGVTKWDIVNPVPPELWLLPDWTPISPWRWWIHMRQVMLPMSYLWSKKWVYPQAESDPLIRELRQELFVQPYESINWSGNRNSISPRDNFHPKSWVLNLINWLLILIWIPYLRTAALVSKAEKWAWKLVQMEDQNSDYSCLGPVNAVMNTLVCLIEEGPDAHSVERHRERLQEFLWLTPDGMLMCGTNGVQVWDTAFTIQTLTATGLADEARYGPMLLNALKFLESQQFTSHPQGYETSALYSDPPVAEVAAVHGYRQPRRGGWGFSNRDQGYVVSDCVSEAMKAVLLLQGIKDANNPSEALFPEIMDFERLRWAADIILTMQNDTGGIASYEPRRGSEYLEYLNAAEVFGRIMVEYDYPECTTSCVTAMQLFREAYPDYRKDDIEKFMTRAVDWIRIDQRPDGSWYGAWGICFTYAGIFALESLRTQGEVYANSERVRRACRFFLDRQRADGGWGESYKSCETAEWVEHPDGSQVVNTAWAMISLMEARYPEREPLERAAKLIMQRQKANGEWLQEGIEGVFNKSTMISYPNYKFIFTIKALGMFARQFGDEKIS